MSLLYGGNNKMSKIAVVLVRVCCVVRSTLQRGKEASGEVRKSLFVFCADFHPSTFGRVKPNP